MNAKKSSFFDHVWDFFCSLKLAISTLILLALTSIIGTVIQQNANPQDYVREYGETAYRIFSALNFLDMYHSWWFLTLLTLFAVNLICCSIKRLPRILKLVNQPNLDPDERFYKTLANGGELTVGLAPEEVRDRLAEFLGQKFSRPRVAEGEGVIQLFAQKMPWARFSVYVTHLSILVIFLGAILGTVWGYKAYVNIPEGSSTDKVWPRGSDTPIDLGFEVRCDRFEVQFYPGGMRPKEFVSDLVVLENGKEVVKKTIEVNDPLTYKGITFYQSSYGPMGDPQFHFKVRERATGKTVTVVAHKGQPVKLPGGQAFRVADFTEHFQTFGSAARIEMLPDLTGKNPAGRSRKSFVVLQKFPEFDAQRGGEYIFSLLDYKQRYYTGLQVAKDPGVWVVWLGCFFLVAGTFSAFFLSHRRLWVTVRAEGGKTHVRYGANAHRNQAAFAIWFEDFARDFEESLKK
ncbi:cytochrome c biogenesis protein ResB [Geothermobacter hydrogeniphilus]|uniref:ResB-like domain-containing protein n=1 Tax=Geothermobacter hydrogeniphilus TaxID=1969733 RepID=A0A1X0YBG6_9BACT|nr:cytochrome c biogenesis protein ResB [Geothermobacter hydrogeniphilus]ORJ62433.1 hypothetical protein B5V00_03875 [Geothermobacter hydrogeniphilus]